MTFVYWVSTASARELHRVRRRRLLAVVDDRLRTDVGEHPVEELGVLDRADEGADLVARRPRARPRSGRSSDAIGVSEPVGVLDMPAATGEVVDDRDLVPRAEKRIAVGQPRYPSPPRIRRRIAREQGSERAASATTAPPILRAPMNCPSCPGEPLPSRADRAARGRAGRLRSASRLRHRRRRSLRNADVLILLAIALGLAIVSGTQLLDALLSAFSFKKGNGTRIVGVAVFAIVILFLLVLRSLSQGSRITRELSGLLEGLAWEEFRAAGNPERFRDKLGVLIPAYNEADSIAAVLDRIPSEVCGLETARPGGRRRLPRRHRGRRRRPWRCGGEPPDQPRRRRRAAHRLPAALRLRCPNRRHPRRRRPAPPRGDGAAGRAGGLGARSPWRTARGCWARPSPTTLHASWGSCSSTASSASSPARR